MIPSEDKWLQEAGEVELIGGWAQVALSDDFAAQVNTSEYQVLLTSYDAVAVFVQNRTARSFEIHALPTLPRRRTSPIRCGYRVMAPRR